MTSNAPGLAEASLSSVLATSPAGAAILDASTLRPDSVRYSAIAASEGSSSSLSATESRLTPVALAKKGAAGIIDISPFTCMNGIVCEAIYPRISRDLGGLPIRNFYFDGTQSDLDRDLGVYMELARNYQRKRA